MRVGSSAVDSYVGWIGYAVARNTISERTELHQERLTAVCRRQILAAHEEIFRSAGRVSAVEIGVRVDFFGATALTIAAHGTGTRRSTSSKPSSRPRRRARGTSPDPAAAPSEGVPAVGEDPFRGRCRHHSGGPFRGRFRPRRTPVERLKKTHSPDDNVCRDRDYAVPREGSNQNDAEPLQVLPAECF